MRNIQIIAGGSVATASPPLRIRRLGKTTPFAHAAYTPAPNVICSQAGAAAGVLTGGGTLRGISPGNIAGLVHYAASALSTGSDVARTDLLTNAAIGAWGYGAAGWTATSGNVSFGSSSLRPVQWIRSELYLSFETDAPTVGIAGGTTNILPVIRAWIDQLDGAGYKEAAPLRPYPQAVANGSTVYFDMSDAQPRALRRWLVRVSGAFASLVLRPGDVLRPYDIRKSALMVATFGDSIGPVLNRVVTQIGGMVKVHHGDGGTGYGKPLNYKADGASSATSNADCDHAKSLTSFAGNVGFNDGSAPVQVEGGSTARTDALIAGRPDVVIGAMGINDGQENSAGTGWSLTNATYTTWQRLRAGCGSSLLVCVAPWTGAQRGVNGISGGEQVARLIIRDQFARIAGPTLWIDNTDSTWILRRADGSVVNGSTGAGPWVTGIGTVQAPTGVGNADLYVGDGTHPGDFASTTLSSSVTLPVSTLPVVASSAGSSNFPPSGKVSIQLAGAVAYPGQVITYTGKGTGTLTGCTGGTGTFPAGSQVFLYDTVPGVDYYGDKVAAAVCAALAVL